jgi:PEP-CTERM motif
MIKNILVAAAFGVAAVAAQASPVNLVSNGSFDGTTSDYVYNGTPASVATFYSGTVPVQVGTVAGWDGSFVSITSNSGPWQTPGSLPGFNAGAQGGYVAGVQADATLDQALALAAGTYTLTWTTANRGADQTYSVLFNGEQIDQLTTTTGAGWMTESVTFTTGGGVGLSFVGDTSFGERDATSLIDNVSVTAAVPEPTALLMMAVATLGLLAWRRRTQA